MCQWLARDPPLHPRSADDLSMRRARREREMRSTMIGTAPSSSAMQSARRPRERVWLFLAGGGVEVARRP